MAVAIVVSELATAYLTWLGLIALGGPIWVIWGVTGAYLFRAVRAVWRSAETPSSEPSLTRSSNPDIATVLLMLLPLWVMWVGLGTLR